MTAPTAPFPTQRSTADTEPTPSETDPDRVPIAALGASAGGLEALESFVGALPTDTGMAFVVIMHLSPKHESNLSAILQHRTELPVHRIEADTTPEPDTVYVLPPETRLGIEDGRLRTSGPSTSDIPPTVIDTFFRTLAADRGEHGVGIVLSGTGTDGTRGMKAIEDAGGVTMAQCPEEATYDGMPWSVVATGIVDVVAPAEQLAAELGTLGPRVRSECPPGDGAIIEADGEETETRQEEPQSVTEAVNTTNQGGTYKQAFNHKATEPRRSNSDRQSPMEAPRVATLCLDRTLRIRRVTPRVQELFDIRATDLGRPLADLHRTFAFDRLVDEAQAVLDTLQPVEAALRTEEGRRLLVQIRPHRTMDNEVDGVVVTFVDVTEQKEAHRRTKREREYAENIVNTVREPLLVLDEELRVQSANDAFHETFEVPREGTTGRRVYELGEGQWDVPELRALLNKVLAEDAVIDDVELDRHFEGLGRRVMQLSARRIDEKELILVAIEDVTALRRATQRARRERTFVNSVLDTVGALVVVLDAEGRIVRFNEECESVTGYAFEEVEGKHVVDLLVPPGERNQVRDLFADLRRGEAPLHHENHWQTQEGEPRLIRWSNTVLRNDEGEVEYVVGTGIDVTERRRLEREVIAASEEERRRIGEDLHDTLASHLAGTAMMADGIADKLADETPGAAEEVRKVASLTREAGEQARSLSHSLLPLEVKDGALMDGLQKMAERQEKMRSVVCSFESGEDVPSVTGDVASHLYRIASEAVHNAVTHADPDTVAICLDTEGDHLVLDVRDDGVGISEHVEPSDGVGIHVMQYRAHLIGADLDVEPAADGGTLVRCRLPLEAVS